MNNDCPICNGTGVSTENCHACGGQGTRAAYDRRRDQGNALIGQEPDRLSQLEKENQALRDLSDLAAKASVTFEDWLGQASTMQAAKDAMWRLGRALRQNGYPSCDRDDLDWRGSILKELNDAGFYPSTTDPYHDSKPDFVYDPEAPQNRRIFGNAVGPTLVEIVAEWKLFRAGPWIPATDHLPAKPGELSRPVWAQVQEFGCAPAFSICKCWISIDHPLLPKWYLDMDFYHLDNPIATGPVVCWMDLPKPWEGASNA